MHTLLSALSWPREHLAQRGALTWTGASSNGQCSCAQVVVHDKTVTLKGWRQVDGRSLLPHLEARWSQQGKELKLVHATRFGLTHPLDPGRLLADFRREVELLNVRPKFQVVEDRT